MKPKVTIVIADYNGTHTKECLKSLTKTKYPNYEIYLMDNYSTNEHIKSLPKIKGLTIFNLSKNYGYSKAMNEGWKIAIARGAKYIATIDNDTKIIQADWLDKLVEHMEHCPDVGVIGCKLVFKDNTLQTPAFEENRSALWEHDVDVGQADFISEANRVGGACSVIRNSITKKVGFFDENMFYAPTDHDYCLRAKKAGYKVIYNGYVKAIHYGSSSYKNANRSEIFFPMVEGNIIFEARHNGFWKTLKLIMKDQVRVFVTPIEPFNYNLDNLKFHWDFLMRELDFIAAVGSGLNKFREVGVINIE